MIMDKAQEKLKAKLGEHLTTVTSKTGAMAGSKVGALLGHAGDTSGLVGGLVGTAVGVGTTLAPKEAVKAVAGAATGTVIKEGTKRLVVETGKRAAVVGATEAGKATMKFAAARGAASAAAGGFAALAGELAGGYLGKKIGKRAAGERGKLVGKELGALTGSAGAGAAAGALVAGPVGALAGAGVGAASYGIGKATGALIDTGAAFEGVVLVQPQLQTGSLSTCTQEEAAYCIITEESPGLGKCFAYYYSTLEEAQKHFEKWWCSRIMFGMRGGFIASELQRGGWPWNQALILAAAKELWGDALPPIPALVYRWTAHGVEEAQAAGLSDFWGNPKAGESLTDDQFESFALGGTSVDDMARVGFIEGALYKWTAVGVAAAETTKVWEFLGSPAAGDLVTDRQFYAFNESETTLDALIQQGYLEVDDGGGHIGDAGGGGEAEGQGGAEAGAV